MRVLPYAAASLLGLATGCPAQPPVNVKPDFDTASLEMKVVMLDQSPPPSVSVPLPPPRFTPEEERIRCPQFPVTTHFMGGNWHFNGAAWVWARGYCYRGEDPRGMAGGPYLLVTRELAEQKLKFYPAAYSAGRYRPAFWRQETRVEAPPMPQPPPPPVQLPPPRPPADPSATQAPAGDPAAPGAPAQSPSAPAPAQAAPAPATTP